MLMSLTTEGSTRLAEVASKLLVFEMSGIAYGSSGFNPGTPTLAIPINVGLTSLVAEVFRKPLQASCSVFEEITGVSPTRKKRVSTYTSLGGDEYIGVVGEAGLYARVISEGDSGLPVGYEFLIAVCHFGRKNVTASTRFQIKWPVEEPVPVPSDFPNVSLLLPMQGAVGASVFTDYSLYSNVVTPAGDLGPPVTSGAGNPNPLSQPVSYYNNGSGQKYLEVPTSPLFDFLDLDFTIEMWMRVPALANYDTPICIGNASNTGGMSLWYLIDQTAGIAYLYYCVDGTTLILANSSAWALANNWHFWAISRNGPDLRLFWDGVQVGATHGIGTASLFESSSVPGTKVYIGSAGPSFYSSSMAGNILDLRITKGIGRYPANFAVPTAPFPTS